MAFIVKTSKAKKRVISGGTAGAPTYTDTTSNDVLLVTVTDDTKADQVTAEAAYASSVLEVAQVDGGLEHNHAGFTAPASHGDIDPITSSASYATLAEARVAALDPAVNSAYGVKIFA